MPGQHVYRNTHIDNIKGLLILLAVLGHVVEPLTGPQPYLYKFYAFIYIFHMPAFLFLSGYLSKGGEHFNPGKITVQLIVPFIVFNSIYELVFYIQNDEISNYVKGIAPNWILWFLASLIFMRMISPVIMKLKYPVLFTVIIAIAASAFSYNGFTLNASRTFVFMPFYIAGCVLYKKTQGNQSFTATPASLLMAMPFLIFCYVIADRLNLVALYGSIPLAATGMSLSDIISTRLLYFVLTALAIASVCVVASGFSWLRCFGKQSLYVYLWHGLVVKYLFWPHLTFVSSHIIAQVLTFILLALSLTLLLSRDVVAHFTQRLLQPVVQLLRKKDSVTSR